MDRCPKCGHVRYEDDLFDGSCDACCEWITGELSISQRYAEQLDDQLADANERADRAEAMIFRPALGSIEIKTSPYVPEGILLCHPATLDAAHANLEGK